MAAGSDVEKVLASLDLVDLVGEHVRLVKAGKTFKGICPFHPDTKPSLTVSPDKQLWYCFGCHDGGTALQFLMKLEGLSFVEALRELAHKAGVSLQGPSPAGGEQREQVFGLNERAAQFYQACLKSKEGEGVRNYLEGRGISADSVNRFELGCTPASSSGLFEHLVHCGEKAQAVLQAGLCLKSEIDGGFSDRFRGRLIFPIRDTSGRLSGFGGRAIDDREPKYINSSETPVFSKGSLLYGLHLAKGPISKTGKAILVEGYMDVIACFQAGVENVVATLGTALGEKHVNILRRYAESVVAAYDSDSSGFQAMVRSTGMFEVANMVLRMAKFPGGEDPDEVIRRRGREAFLAAIETALPATEFRLEMALAAYDAESPEKRRPAAVQVAAILSTIQSPVEQAHYISTCAAKMSAGNPERARTLEEALLAQVSQARKKQGNKQVEQDTALGSAVEALPRGVVEAEKAVLRAILDQPELAAQLSTRLGSKDFHHPDHIRIAEGLFPESGQEGSVTSGSLAEAEGTLAALFAKIALDGDDIHAVTDGEVIDGYVKAITDFGKERRWKAIQEETVRCLKEGTKPADPSLLDEYKELARYLVGGPDRQDGGLR